LIIFFKFVPVFGNYRIFLWIIFSSKGESFSRPGVEENVSGTNIFPNH